MFNSDEEDEVIVAVQQGQVRVRVRMRTRSEEPTAGEHGGTVLGLIRIRFKNS